MKFLPAMLLKRDRCFPGKYTKFGSFKNIFFYRTTPVTASEQTQEISEVPCVVR